MQKVFGQVYIIIALFIISIFGHSGLCAHNPTEPPHTKEEPPKKNFLPNIDKNAELNEWIQKGAKLYKELDKSACVTPLKLDVFLQAYIGMVNLKTSHILDKQSHIITIADYSLSANVPRLWLIDLKDRKVLYNTLVSHGQGSGEEYAVSFSNTENSHQTSLGFFLTDTTYIGRNGYSLRLHGLDIGYNDRALDRAIVIHGAAYVNEKFIEENQRLGRSWGCPALPENLNREIIDIIKEGTLFFAYYPDHKYLTTSIWLNKTPLDSNQKNIHHPSHKPVMHAQNNTDSVSANAPVNSNTL